MKRKLMTFFLSFLMVIAAAFAVYANDFAGSASQLDYVTDTYGLLNDGEWSKLEQEAQMASERYECGIYLITVDDYRKYGSGDVFDVAADLYHEYVLGMGSERNGIVLLLSMNTRDYALFVYGDAAQYAFDDYGLRQLEDEFLDDLGDNRWYDGFADYISTCERYLALAEEGEPMRASKGPAIVIVFAGSMIISLIVCLILGSGMKNVRKQAKADHYVTDEGLDLSRKEDVFVRRTETRTKIEKQSSSSGSRSGRGGSGRSGKF